MEHFSNNLIAVKFYYKGVRWSKDRYSLMTNDNEPRRIVYSCLELIKRYYIKDNTISFGFIAAQDSNPQKTRKHENRRFQFYKTVVNYYFGTKTFSHVDDGSRVYLLLNRQQLKLGAISMQTISDEINRIYEGDFNFSWD